MTPKGRGRGIGASPRRKEDLRFLTGQGRYVGDIMRSGMLEVAFLRSPVAHARIRGLTKPAGLEKRVYTIDDFPGVRTIRANSALPGFRISEQSVLAKDKIRHVGEAIAACVAESRAAAEDLAAACELHYEILPAVSEMVRAQLPGMPLIHEDCSRNAFLETNRNDDVSGLDAIAVAKVTRTLRTSRQCMAPLDGRGVLAEWDPRLEQIVVTTSAQMPHVTKSGLADCLGLDEGRVRIVSPDVGGGFGYKGILLPEEVVLARLAMTLGRPVLRRPGNHEARFLLVRATKELGRGRSTDRRWRPTGSRHAILRAATQSAPCSARSHRRSAAPAGLCRCECRR